MQGFVLLIMLVYLQIFSLLSFQGMMTVLYQQKSLRQQLLMIDRQQKLQEILGRVDRIEHPSCEVPLQDYKAMNERSLAWWQRHGCHLKVATSEYFFVREDLGSDVCAAVISANKQVVRAHYYRNTLRQVSGLSSLLVQDTIVLAGSLPPACGNPRQLIAGRQMLRWLW